MNRKEWVVPNNPGICQYHPHKLDNDPHNHGKWKKLSNKLAILPNILHSIHNTPLIRINNITKNENLECEILAKCEFFSAGGSVKDRIGCRMLEDAEESGILKKGCTLIEPTSGNTGIGLALACCVKGYKCVIVIPEKMSKEKIDIIRALGAEIVQTPTAASFSSEQSNFGMSAKLVEKTPKAIVLNQFRNAANAICHYDYTAAEILDACEDKVDMLVCSIGTGGTITGIARRVKEVNQRCQVIGVDPVGSMMALPPCLNSDGPSFYEIEGIGGDFIPTILNRNVVDHWCKVTDKEAFHMARRLIREEGLLCGGSSGAAMHCAVHMAKQLKLGKDKRVVVVLPDSIRNYVTKFLNDDWLNIRGLQMGQNKEEIERITWWRSNPVSRLKILGIKTLISSQRLYEVVSKMTTRLPVCAVRMKSSGKIVGILTGTRVCRSIMTGHYKAVLAAVMYENFKQISSTDNLANLSVLFQYDDYVLVFEHEKEEKSLLGIVTRASLGAYIAKGYDNY